MELVSAVLILSILLGAFARYAVLIFSRAEQSLVERTVININTALNHRASLFVLRENYELLGDMLEMNPMEEMQSTIHIKDIEVPLATLPLAEFGAILRVPSNYGGVIYFDDEDYVEKGKWYFNNAEKYIVYFIRTSSLITGNSERMEKVRYRINMHYDDKDADGEFNPNVDEFRAMKLISVDYYQWQQ